MWITSFGDNKSQTINFLQAETTCLLCLQFYSFNKYVLCIYHILDHVLSNGDTSINKIDKNPCLFRTNILARGDKQ